MDGYWLPGGDYFWESCDDANVESGDGCSATCETELGWICDQPGELCRDPVCGDGRLDYWMEANEGQGGTGGGSAGLGSGGSAGGLAGTGGAGGWSSVIFRYEACDDGNAISGDGCSASCEPEAGYACHQPGLPCREPRCGDNFMDFIPGTGGAPGSGGFGGTGPSGHYEGCDDGNVSPGDGCDTSCRLETGWACGLPGPCHPVVCGDGRIDFIRDAGSTPGYAGYGGGGPGGHYEGCDDANVLPGDGCDASCRVEDGWVCWGQGAGVCHQTVCGDGLVEGAEHCDDGNQTPADGCHECVYDGGGWGGGPPGTGGFGNAGPGYAGTGG
jgi:cysteine-rich repeat protein